MYNFKNKKYNKLATRVICVGHLASFCYITKLVHNFVEQISIACIALCLQFSGCGRDNVLI
jgi:hypothetical protein